MTRTTNERDRGTRGFSLVELMVVITILGLLAGIVATNVFGLFAKAQVDIAKQDMHRLVEGIEVYRVQEGALPETLEDLFDEGGALRGDGPPVDPWGHAYEYERIDGTQFTLVCRGADGREGGEGDAADITRADLKRVAKED